MEIEKITPQEEIKLKNNTCPDCGGKNFLKGPCGGLAVNVKCANPKCGSKFNICWPFLPERI